MNTKVTSHNSLEDFKVNLKLKLASLWASIMFLYIYVDYFHLYMPSKIEEIKNGIVFEFNISQGFLLGALASMTIPSLMIFLSVTLPAKINRCINIIISTLYIPFTLYNLTGDTWIHMWFGAIVEVIILCLIICYALKWPKIEK